MSQFEYVSVLTSLILGLGIAQILSNISDAILSYEKIKFYPLHTLWVILIFGFHIQEWWINFAYSRVIMEWKLINFFFLISYPIILFTLSRLLFPSIRSGEVDLKKYFMENRRMIFSIAFFLPVFSIPQNMLIGYSFTDQIGQIFIGIMFLLLVITNTKKEIIHYLFAGTLLIMSLVYMFYLNPKL